MPRPLFEQELRRVQEDVLLLGSMVDHAISEAIEALLHSDLHRARLVVEGDQDINRKRFAIEEACIHIMATQQPLATDLRILVAVLSIITDLERMGDHAEGIGRITLMMVGEQYDADLGYIPEMATKAREMLRQSLSAFVERDVETAQTVCARDDEVDALYDTVYATAINRMVKQPSLITPQTYLLWTAHNLERIADRTTNIAERVAFLVTGHMAELNVSRY
jgi:phosphate transport system protein